MSVEAFTKSVKTCLAIPGLITFPVENSTPFMFNIPVPDPPKPCQSNSVCLPIFLISPSPKSRVQEDEAAGSLVTITSSKPQLSQSP